MEALLQRASPSLTMLAIERAQHMYRFSECGSLGRQETRNHHHDDRRVALPYESLSSHMALLNHHGSEKPSGSQIDGSSQRSRGAEYLVVNRLGVFEEHESSSSSPPSPVITPCRRKVCEPQQSRRLQDIARHRTTLESVPLQPQIRPARRRLSSTSRRHRPVESSFLANI